MDLGVFRVRFCVAPLPLCKSTTVFLSFSFNSFWRIVEQSCNYGWGKEEEEQQVSLSAGVDVCFRQRLHCICKNFPLCLRLLRRLGEGGREGVIVCMSMVPGLISSVRCDNDADLRQAETLKNSCQLLSTELRIKWSPVQTGSYF